MKTQWSGIRGVTFFSGSLAVLLITTLVAHAQDEKASATSIKMTCTEHGDAAMTLIGVKEDGTGRTIVIDGTTSTSKWTVTIDGADKTPRTQTAANPGEVKLHAGDKITWKRTGSTHGIVFPTQTAAESFFKFDTAQGKTLAPSTRVPNYKWGTAAFDGSSTEVILAVAEVN
jgi:plastocyanin